MSGLVIVGGGSGFIGRSLCSALQKSGYEAVIVSRHAKRKQNAVTWDDIKSNGLPDGTHAVINLAGEPAFNILRRWNDDLISDIYKSRIGTTNILKQAILNASNPPKFWGTISAVGYYKTDEHRVYDETSAVEKQDFWTKMVAKWESAAMLPDSVSVRHCIIRSGIVLGKDGGPFPQMVLPFKLCLGGPIGSGNQWFPWIHIDDMVGIFMHALDNESVTGVLNGVAPKICTNKEFTQTLASVLHRPAFFQMPGFLLNAAYGPIRASMVLEGQNVTPKLTLKSGYKYLYSSVDGALVDLVS